LLDIKLGDGMDGITTARQIREWVQVPFIFVTAHSDNSTFERAKQIQPDAYIIKPFNFQYLYAAIELALFNHSLKKTPHPEELLNGSFENTVRPDHYVINNILFVKTGKIFEKVNVKDICYIRADGSYSILHSRKREFTIGMNLSTVQEKINKPEIIRIHRSYLVNINCIDRIEDHEVIINDFRLPISKKMKDELLRRLTLL
jgi:DNA-binding LytR/AlgR family response regulator